eukprot:15463115-Alexandrium_andersonii.AAC.1
MPPLPIPGKPDQAECCAGSQIIQWRPEHHEGLREGSVVLTLEAQDPYLKNSLEVRMSACHKSPAHRSEITENRSTIG